MFKRLLVVLFFALSPFAVRAQAETALVAPNSCGFWGGVTEALPALCGEGNYTNEGIYRATYEVSRIAGIGVPPWGLKGSPDHHALLSSHAVEVPLEVLTSACASRTATATPVAPRHPRKPPSSPMIASETAGARSANTGRDAPIVSGKTAAADDGGYADPAKMPLRAHEYLFGGLFVAMFLGGMVALIRHIPVPRLRRMTTNALLAALVAVSSVACGDRGLDVSPTSPSKTTSNSTGSDESDADQTTSAPVPAATPQAPAQPGSAPSVAYDTSCVGTISNPTNHAVTYRTVVFLVLGPVTNQKWVAESDPVSVGPRSTGTIPFPKDRVDSNLECDEVRKLQCDPWKGSAPGPQNPFDIDERGRFIDYRTPACEPPDPCEGVGTPELAFTASRDESQGTTVVRSTLTYDAGFQGSFTLTPAPASGFPGGPATSGAEYSSTYRNPKAGEPPFEVLNSWEVQGGGQVCASGSKSLTIAPAPPRYDIRAKKSASVEECAEPGQTVRVGHGIEIANTGNITVNIQTVDEKAPGCSRDGVTVGAGEAVSYACHGDYRPGQHRNTVVATVTGIPEQVSASAYVDFTVEECAPPPVYGVDVTKNASDPACVQPGSTATVNFSGVVQNTGNQDVVADLSDVLAPACNRSVNLKVGQSAPYSCSGQFSPGNYVNEIVATVRGQHASDTASASFTVEQCAPPPCTTTGFVVLTADRDGQDHYRVEDGKTGVVLWSGSLKKNKPFRPPVDIPIDGHRLVFYWKTELLDKTNAVCPSDFKSNWRGTIDFGCECR